MFVLQKVAMHLRGRLIRARQPFHGGTVSIGGISIQICDKLEEQMPIRLLLVALLASAALPGQTTLTSTATQRYFNSIRRNLEASADVMPADKYAFRLTPGQMTFGEWLIHSAQRNFIDCAALKGETPPQTDAQLAALKDKAGIAKALKDSFAYCAATIDKLDDAKVLASPQSTYSFLHIIVHNNEIYGNIVGYMRASGIVPPSTAGRGRQGR
jgi:hypothetical protein